jgi:hypothetical protein
MVEIECDKCGRHGRLRQIAQCPNWGSTNDGCQARYSPSSQIR